MGDSVSLWGPFSPRLLGVPKRRPRRGPAGTAFTRFRVTSHYVMLYQLGITRLIRRQKGRSHGSIYTVLLVQYWGVTEGEGEPCRIG